MNLIFLIISFLYTSGVAGIDWKHLHVTFKISGGYFKMPVTKDQIIKEGFTLMAHDAELNIDLFSLPDDPRVSICVDGNGNIAGLRIGYIKADVGIKAAQNKGAFPTQLYDNNKMYGSAKYWNKDVWYNTVLFISPETLKGGGRKSTGGLVAEDVYLKMNGEWQALPKNEGDAESRGFKKQTCFDGMGMHYFYGLSKQSKCEDFTGEFLMYEDGKMIGLGLSPLGSFTHGQREWFEDPPLPFAKKINPNSPDCFDEWVPKYGLTSLHLFFKENPKSTVCKK